MSVRLAILFGSALLLAGCAASPDYGYSYGYAANDYGGWDNSYGPYTHDYGYGYGYGPSLSFGLGRDRDRGDRDRRAEFRGGDRDRARAGSGGERRNAEAGRGGPRRPAEHDGDRGHDRDH
jgi:hypothetical protein